MGIEPLKDIFISYSSKDATFVQRLADDLSAQQLKVWLDKFEMKVGDSLNQKLQEGISSSGWLGVVLSPNSISSAWVTRELNAALMQELERKQVFVLPILYQNCDIPIFLRDKVYADFRSSYQDGLRALLERLDPPLKADLLERLMSGTPSVIASAFAKLKPETKEIYFGKLIENLGSASVSAKTAALTALFVLRHKDLSGHLLRMATDKSSSVRRYALFYLGELRAKYAVKTVSELLSDKNLEVRAAARDAYKKISGERA
jgi:hypothetical protein